MRRSRRYACRPTRRTVPSCVGARGWIGATSRGTDAGSSTADRARNSRPARSHSRSQPRDNCWPKVGSWDAGRARLRRSRPSPVGSGGWRPDLVAVHDPAPVRSGVRRASDDASCRRIATSLGGRAGRSPVVDRRDCHLCVRASGGRIGNPDSRGLPPSGPTCGSRRLPTIRGRPLPRCGRCPI